MRFEKKCILVTGGASGIGRAVCLAFAREGANISVADLSPTGAEATAKEVREHGRKASGFEVDVTNPDAVKKIVELVVSEFGHIDTLVNCAGIREIVPFLKLSYGEWQHIIDTNLTGTFLFSQAVAQHFIERGIKGNIVNLASVAGFMGVPNRAAYVASKHAVVGLTKEMALELGSSNIRVNAVAPAVVETSMTAQRLQNPEIASAVKKAIPLNRWGQPDEIASVILFITSEDAAFMTGSIVPVDGGYSAGKGFFVEKGDNLSSTANSLFPPQERFR